MDPNGKNEISNSRKESLENENETFIPIVCCLRAVANPWQFFPGNVYTFCHSSNVVIVFINFRGF